MNSVRTLRLYKFLTFLALALVITRVYPQSSASGLYEDALQRNNEGDPASALIQLKNALQQDGQHVPSLVLMGEIFMKLQEPEEAEHAFSQAMLFGADNNYLAPKLASAYLMQGKFNKLLVELPADYVRGRAKAELLGYRAMAFLALDDLAAAQRAVDEADAVYPGALISNVARVNLLLVRGSLDDALRTARQLTEVWPDLAQSWDRLGLVLQAQGNNTAALEAYNTALQRDPEYGSSRLARAALLVDLNRDGEASTDLDLYLSEYPLDPRGVYLRAQLNDRAGNEVAAKKDIQRVSDILQALPAEQVLANQQLSMIGAMANYRLGKFETTRTYLEAYLKYDADNTQAVLMLSSILLELGEPNQAQELLKPVFIMQKDDPAVMSMMIRVYTEAGRHENAVQLLLGLGDQLVPGKEAYTQLALNRLSMGQTTEGLTALEEVYRGDKSRLGEGFSLAITYLEMGDAEEAAAIAAELTEYAPDTLAFHNLLGMAQLASGELDKARATFMHTAELDSSFFPAQVGLARVERTSGNLESARTILEGILGKDADNVSAMMEMSQLELAAKNPGGALTWAEEAGRADPENKLPLVLQVEVMIESGQLDAAEKLARSITVKFDEDLQALDILAKVQSVAGKRSEALQTYRRMQKLAGFNTDQLYRLALLQMRLGGWNDARYTLYKATKGRPDHIPSMLAYQRVLRLVGEMNEALEISDSLIEMAPDLAEARGQRAHTLFAMGQYGLADTGYQEALAISYDPRWTIGRHRSLVAQQLADRAETVLRETLASHPKDTLLRGALIDYLLEQQQWPDAKQELEVQLELQPGNAALLNNMAFTLNELGDDRALGFARQAHNLAPHDAAINDTLGWILVSGGTPSEGLPHLREASSRMTNNPQIRYHLAVALHKLGREKEASRELQQALATGAEFPEREAARELLRSIRPPT